MTKVQSVIREQLCVGVTTRKVKNDTMTVWDIQVGDGSSLTTFQSPLGNKALGYVGSICDFQITIDGPNDKGFTNFYLEGIQRSPNVTQPSPVVQAAQVAQAAQGGVSYDQYKDLSKEQEERKNLSIHRQTAGKVAAALLPESPEEFWTNVQDLVNFFQTGENPFYRNPQGGGSEYNPAYASQGVPADEPDTDDDIPF